MPQLGELGRGVVVELPARQDAPAGGGGGGGGRGPPPPAEAGRPSGGEEGGGCADALELGGDPAAVGRGLEARERAPAGRGGEPRPQEGFQLRELQPVEARRGPAGGAAPPRRARG